ncbi:glycosyltransferase [Candidatus Aalborgicola defluviihabitans]|jgi:glycosyltransferase involved in cell wall biosynthesis|uniref:glycosyltransferase n=1 Tax=Candidatus Aalborgicola defluviihabitans TaxID=3386187 RepID=UPI001D822FD8|nr:glycosyltransferase [Burkholderiales bacterium]MBK6569434.1 glycosyltransferase [Burkholderiales bacterium]MBK7315873.1 glycosyltransferase [Burkholderiales bacterium]MBL0243872.1 glycosyltransferase [Rhodoferax sp.]
MRVLFSSVYPHLPDVIGGLQTTTDDLCTALVNVGAQAAVLCGQNEHDTTGHALPRRDDTLGYPVFRVADPIHDLPLLAASWEPSIIVVQSGTTLLPMVISALDTGQPTAVYLHNVETHQLGGTLVPDASILYLANSEFTAQRWHALCGLNCVVVPPLVLPERYFVPERGEQVLFVNPTQIKGVEIMFALAAACPDIPFLVSESWGLNPNWRNHCLQRARRLPNIEWIASTRDMRAVYTRARTLLMPSLWEESYGRTVVEAQISGIPVVASKRGALPEVMGAGGLLVDAHAPISEWERALRRAYMPSLTYDRLSEQARQQAYHTAASPVMLSRFLSAIAGHGIERSSTATGL